VLVPKSNGKNLMLKNEVIDAVKKRQFHIYHVSGIKEGIEILTGVKAGEADKDGNFPKNTVYGRVQQKLETYLQRSINLKEKFES
jgi:predicted ATP-dependent protease